MVKHLSKDLFISEKGATILLNINLCLNHVCAHGGVPRMVAGRRGVRRDVDDVGVLRQLVPQVRGEAGVEPLQISVSALFFKKIII